MRNLVCFVNNRSSLSDVRFEPINGKILTKVFHEVKDPAILQVGRIFRIIVERIDYEPNAR